MLVRIPSLPSPVFHFSIQTGASNLGVLTSCRFSPVGQHEPPSTYPLIFFSLAKNNVNDSFRRHLASSVPHANHEQRLLVIWSQSTDAREFGMPVVSPRSISSTDLTFIRLSRQSKSQQNLECWIIAPKPYKLQFMLHYCSSVRPGMITISRIITKSERTTQPEILETRDIRHILYKAHTCRTSF